MAKRHPAKPIIEIPIQGAVIVVPNMNGGMTFTVEVGRINQGMGHGYDCLKVIAPKGFYASMTATGIDASSGIIGFHPTPETAEKLLRKAQRAAKSKKRA